MDNRNAFLSFENEHLKSDFNRIATKIDREIDALQIAFGENFPQFDPEEKPLSPAEKKKTPAEQLAIRREHYINQLSAWLKKFKTAIDRKYSDALDIPLSQASISEDQKSKLLTSIFKIEKDIDALKEACEIERYQKPQEIQTTPQGKVFLKDLTLEPASGDFILAEEKRPFPARLRGVQGRTHKDPAEWTVRVTQEEYLALQEFGATSQYRVDGHLIDKCLTAQIINIFGTFHRQQTYALVRFRAATETFFAKETMCQHAFKRLRALRNVASALGGSIRELSDRLAEYKSAIENLKANIAAEKSDDEQNPHLDARQKAWFASIYNAYNRGLDADLAELAAFQKKLQSVIREDSPSTLFELGHWLQLRVHHIIATARRASNVLDTAERGSLSTGQFIQMLAHADTYCMSYRFDYTGRMDPEYQGIFDPQNRGKTRILSSAHLAHDRRDVRDAFFGISCVVAGITKPEQIRALYTEINPTFTTSLGWLRMPRLCGSRSKQHAQILDDIESAETLTQSQQIFQLYEFLRKTEAAEESIGHAFWQFGVDFSFTAAATAVETGHAVSEFFSNFFRKVSNDFTYKVTRVSTQIKINEKADSLVVFSSATSAAEEKHDEDDLEFSAKPSRVLLPKWQPYDPHTIPSMLADVVSSIGNFYCTDISARPTFYTLTGTIGIFASIAAYHREAVASIVGSKLTEYFVITNEAVTSSQKGQALGAPSTWMMGSFLLQIPADGANALLIRGLKETYSNWPLIIVGIGASYGTGEVFARNFESVKEELGTQPWIAKIFAGLKLIALLHDATKHLPGERNTFANTISMLANTAGDGVRALFSFAHLLAALKATMEGDYQRSEIAGAHFLRPWHDLMETSFLLLLNTLDGGLQIATTGVRGTSSVSLAATNTVTYALAKFISICSTRASRGLVNLNESFVETIGEIGLELKHHTADRFRMFLEHRNSKAADAEKAAHSKVVKWDLKKDVYPLTRGVFGSRYQTSKALQHKAVVHDAAHKAKGLVVNSSEG